MTARADVASRLAALEARVWAQMLRTLKRLAVGPGPLADALAHPTGELASGPARRALCHVIAASDEVLDALREDPVLPAAVHAAIAIGGGRDEGPEAADDEAVASPAMTERAVGRARALRRTLDEERRRREGADARAASAESRARDAEEARDVLQARVAELEAEVAAARDAVERSVGRTERRSAARIEGLEQDLTTERSTHGATRRDLEQARAELAELRTERDLLRSRDDPTVATAAPNSPGGVTTRPLVLPPALDGSTTEGARWLAERVSLLLVDGYNAALQLRPGQPLEGQRRWLVERLRPLAVRGGPRPVVIFDGDGATGRMRDTGGVEVRFTAGGMIADDEIVFAVAATDVPVLVITDDVELGERVRAEGGNVVGVLHLPGIVDG